MHSFNGIAQRDIDSIRQLLRVGIEHRDTPSVQYYTAYLGYLFHATKQYDSALAYYTTIVNDGGTDTALLATTYNGMGMEWGHVSMVSESPTAV